MSDHAWSQENLDAYLAGGLSLDERERLETHVAGCDACVSALAAAQKLDRTLSGLFAPVRPDAALEDRAIRKLRITRPRRLSRWSMVLRVAGGVAAVLLIGAVGLAAHALAADGELPFPGLERKARTWSLNDLKEVKQLVQLFDDTGSMDKWREASALRQLNDNVPRGARLDETIGGKDGFSMFNMDLEAKDVNGSVNSLTDRLRTLSIVPGADKPDEPIRRFWSNDDATNLTPYRISGGKGVQEIGNDPLEQKRAAGEGKDGGRPLGESFYGRSGATREYYRTHGDQLAAGQAKEIQDLMTESLPALAAGNRQLPASNVPSFPGAPQVGSKGPVPARMPDPSIASIMPPVFSPPGNSDVYFKPGDARASSLGMNAGSKATDAGVIISAPPPPRPDPTPIPPDAKKADDVVKLRQKETSDKARDYPVGDLVIPIPSVVVQPTKQPEPAPDAARKIIRTGELEFEIDSFDNSVAKIADLINAVKGGFVATVNSDKLPNGKVRGSVVVRMPPQHLDKFLLDLRKELGKVGELKTQRIGSQDVTKQYTDIESRLRAAHTMEDRFIAIIKNGKGEVKDLIAAEKELGVWRTKIEEMEGEIRYYNNQVGLSTLTISLTEKEIQAAAAVVITERVGMRIEVEDVEKAHIDALKAVAEEKGRITKSELKQHPAGQLEAVLQVEVAPEKAKKLRDVFKKLGLVTFNDVQRVQQAVGGGTSGAFEAKLKQADVQINVTLYDTANIQPRESVTMLIATEDVQASYRALQTAVTKAKGQIRVGQLREPDKVNINAEFNFDVPMPEKPGIDLILAKLGVILSSTDSQVPINETATDRKYGYRLVLRNLATVPARETTILRIAVSDVPTVFRELQDAVLAAKGVIQVQQLNETSKVSVDGVLSFDVPKSDRLAFDKVLAKLGMVLSSTSAKAGANEITTDRKHGYRLDLVSLASIRPREIFTLLLASNDVPASFNELRDAVVQAKGLVHADQLVEDNRINVVAKLDFDVAITDKAAFDKLVAKAGAVLKRSNSQASVNDVSSDKKVGYRLLIHNVAAVPPRETTTLKIEVDDVDKTANELSAMVRASKGQASRSKTTTNPQGETTTVLKFDVPLAAADAVLPQIVAAAKHKRVLEKDQTQNTQIPDNELATAQFIVTLTGGQPTIPTYENMWTPIQNSLYISFKVLTWSVMLIILGLCVVLPWVVVVWLCVKIVRRLRGKPQVEAA